MRRANHCRVPAAPAVRFTSLGDCRPLIARDRCGASLRNILSSDVGGTQCRVRSVNIAQQGQGSAAHRDRCRMRDGGIRADYQCRQVQGVLTARRPN
ncbi:hypothetical protein [Microvirga pakistanensis]|uniref:hypothetical protein n=1 Tax=Microvirga pakistanensis TaxID=1682650 RepID=UPI003CC808BE